jgi:hypothetical protein
LDLDLVSGECFFVRVQVFPYLSFSFVNRLFGTRRISGPSFVFSSLPPFLLGLFTLFGTPWAKGGVLARDLARWLLWRMGAYSPQRPPLASPAPMLRSRVSPGSDARHWSPDVILGFAEYALSFPIYIRLSFSLFAL